MVDLQGDWALQLTFLVGRAAHALHLQQDGSQIRGRLRTQYGEQDINGTVAEDGGVQLRSSVQFQACGAPYNFTGQVDGDSMSGQLSLGEFWTAAWRAERVGAA